MRFLILIFALNLSGSCQSLEDGWKDIRPLKTDKKTVEKILGTPKVDSNGYHGYKIGDVFIQVNYSTEPCVGDLLNRGKYNVPKDTVLEYIVYFHEFTELSKLKFDRKKFTESRSEHLSEVFYLASREIGVIIAAFEQQGREYVSNIEFRPKTKDMEKVKCPKQ